MSTTTGLSPFWLAASGADVDIVQVMLGQKTATMTLDTDGHLFPDRLDEAARHMGDRCAVALREAKAAGTEGPGTAA